MSCFFFKFLYTILVYIYVYTYIEGIILKKDLDKGGEYLCEHVYTLTVRAYYKSYAQAYKHAEGH